MDWLSQILIFLIFLGSVGFAIQPLLQRSIPQLKDEEDLESLRLRKRVIYRQIKELEMDYEIGNLDHSDYLKTRNELKQEASAIIANLKFGTKGKK